MSQQPKQGPPLVFLSHASDDKEGFVEPLGEELARQGVKPWLDRWEIRLGDSLVQRIFDEGLAVADAVVVVVSQHSVDRPWVRDELDAATVRRINDGTRLIPVMIDDVAVPAPLRHLKWVRAERSRDGAVAAATEIAAVMHGTPVGPAVQQPPPYANSAPLAAELTVTDSVVLTEVVREALDQGHLKMLQWENVESRLRDLGIEGAALDESLHALAEADYIDLMTRGGSRPDVDATPLGFATAVEALIPDVEDAMNAIIAELVNDAPSGSDAIDDLAQRVQTPRLVVDMTLRGLEARGQVEVGRYLGNGSRIHSVAPTLKRLLD